MKMVFESGTEEIRKIIRAPKKMIFCHKKLVRTPRVYKPLAETQKHLEQRSLNQMYKEYYDGNFGKNSLTSEISVAEKEIFLFSHRGHGEDREVL